MRDKRTPKDVCGEAMVDQNLGGTWISLFVVFAPNLKLHHLLYADITKIHKIIFLFRSYVGLDYEKSPIFPQG